MTEDMFIADGFFKIDAYKIHSYQQEVTSAETCRNQKAAGARILSGTYRPPKRVLDFGGGKYSEAQEFLQSMGFVCEVYDPYNRSYDENLQALQQKYDLMMCNNVLNVLTDTVLHYVIQDMRLICDMCGITGVIVTVYERDRNGQGRMTGDNTYQRNEKTADYIEPLKKHFSTVQKSGKSLLVTP